MYETRPQPLLVFCWQYPQPAATTGLVVLQCQPGLDLIAPKIIDLRLVAKHSVLPVSQRFRVQRRRAFLKIVLGGVLKPKIGEYVGVIGIIRSLSVQLLTRKGNCLMVNMVAQTQWKDKLHFRGDFLFQGEGDRINQVRFRGFTEQIMIIAHQNLRTMRFRAVDGIRPVKVASLCTQQLTGSLVFRPTYTYSFCTGQPPAEMVLPGELGKILVGWEAGHQGPDFNPVILPGKVPDQPAAGKCHIIKVGGEEDPV